MTVLRHGNKAYGALDSGSEGGGVNSALIRATGQYTGGGGLIWPRSATNRRAQGSRWYFLERPGPWVTDQGVGFARVAMG